MLISDLTERELIARVQRALPAPPRWVLVGIGDDAAVVEPERNRVEALTVDAVVEGVHFNRRFTPPAAIGHRALAVNLSDLAAMGAAPRTALLSMALPAGLSSEEFDEIVGGLARLAGAHEIHVVGGNLTRSPGPLVIDVTAIGSVKRRAVLTRSGARAGDEIYVTGTIGAAAAGLQVLLCSASASDSPSVSDSASRSVPLSVPDSDPVSVAGSAPESPSAPLSGSELNSELSSDFVADMRSAVDRYLYPQPRVRTGLLIGRNRAATACMDLSDGLGDAVWQVTEASGVGAIIEADALPIDPDVRRWFEAHGQDPVIEAIRGGDDYELLLTVRPRHRGRLLAARAAGVQLTRIGVCTPERDVRLRRHGTDKTTEAPLPAAGFRHFR